jgi:TRAP-type C4-dicarboxylate transport system substrate-binding protein
MVDSGQRGVRVHLYMVALFIGTALGPGARAHAQTAAPPAPLKLSVVVAPTFALGEAARLWADATRKAANGLFDVTFFPGASLARSNAAEEFRLLKAGELDMAVGSAAFWSEAFPPLGALALPWIAPTDSQVAAIVSDAVVTQKLAAQLATADLVLVHWAPLPHRDLATQNAALTTVDAMQGMRVRVGTTPIILQTYQVLGAKPGVMSYAVAQSAYASGQLDAQDGTAATFAAARSWATGARYLNEWGAFADAMLFVVRRPVWDAWPETLRQQVRTAAESAARDADAPGHESAARATLVANGVNVTRLTQAGHAAFRSVSQPIYDRFTPSIGADLVGAVQEAARKTGE